MQCDWIYNFINLHNKRLYITLTRLLLNFFYLINYPPTHKLTMIHSMFNAFLIFFKTLIPIVLKYFEIYLRIVVMLKKYIHEKSVIIRQVFWSNFYSLLDVCIYLLNTLFYSKLSCFDFIIHACKKQIPSTHIVLVYTTHIVTNQVYHSIVLQKQTNNQSPDINTKFYRRLEYLVNYS